MAALLEGGAQGPAVLGERLRVALVARVLEEGSGRARCP